MEHFALCPRKRDGLLGMGRGGKRMKEWRLNHGYRLKKTGETVDCHQNNGTVKAVPTRHCPATCALHNCWFNCCVWAESQCPLHCCDEQLEQLAAKNFHSPAPPPYSWSLLGYLEDPAPPPYSWSLLGYLEDPAPPPSCKICWSFDLAWNLAGGDNSGHFYSAVSHR